MPRLRVTATLALVLLAGGAGMTWWMSIRPRLHDRPIEAALAAHRPIPPPADDAATRRARRVARAPSSAQSTAARDVSLVPVHAPSPAYPMEALRRERGGVVTLRVSVDGHGDVVHVDVAHSSGDPALDASARKAMRNWRFRAPASHEPVSFDYKVRFRIASPSS